MWNRKDFEGKDPIDCGIHLCQLCGPETEFYASKWQSTSQTYLYYYPTDQRKP